MIDLSIVFVTGLLASLHCVGMCGPIVLAYSLAGSGQAGGVLSRNLGLHAAYNGARIVSYAILGALAGAVGMSLGTIHSAGQYVALVGGILMIVTGVFLLGLLPVPQWVAKGAFGRGVLAIHGSVVGATTIRSKLILGLLTPLLPCGVLYAMAVKAATTQNIGTGALVMAVFAVGMAPALMALGSVSSLFTAKFRKGAEQLAAAGVILLGVMLTLRGLGVPYLAWMHTGQSAAAPSCCH